MFFYFSKLLDVSADPLWWALVLLGAAIGAAIARRHRSSMVLLILSLVILATFSTPAVANQLWYRLESDVESTFRTDQTYDAVILLGGAVSPDGSLPDEPAWNDGVERLLVVHQLLMSGKAKLAIVTGGKLGTGLLTEAEYLQRELVRLGVSEDRVILEPTAVNTRENARASQSIAQRLGVQKLLLVTSAFHVPRALGSFRAVGLQPDVLPVDFRLRDPSVDQHVAPRTEYLSTSARALREWLGRATYRVMGYTR